VGAPLVCAVGTVSPSVIEAAGPAANGVVSADIYFPNVEPFASNPVNQRFVAETKKQFNLVPDKYMALGAAALQLWAEAANEAKTLDRKTVAEAIRGHVIKDTILGNAQFAPNGQLQPSYFLFTVQNEKIIVER
jgi:branched-chain amino acid transport system substrate-binding protein